MVKIYQDYMIEIKIIHVNIEDFSIASFDLKSLTARIDSIVARIVIDLADRKIKVPRSIEFSNEVSIESSPESALELRHYRQGLLKNLPVFLAGNILHHLYSIHCSNDSLSQMTLTPNPTRSARCMIRRSQSRDSAARAGRSGRDRRAPRRPGAGWH